MFCTNCGNKIINQEAFCSNCGMAVNMQPINNRPVQPVGHQAILPRKKTISRKWAPTMTVLLTFLLTFLILPILFYTFVIPGKFWAEMKVENYLEEKYGETFEVTDIHHENEAWGDSHFTATCHPTKNPDIEFNTYVGSSNQPITDDYPGSSN